MKKRNVPLFLFMAFLMLDLSAQKNMILLDMHYVPLRGSSSMGATIGYYRQISERRSLGLKLLHNTNMVGLANGEHRRWSLLLDATQRFRLTKKRRANWFFDIGASVLADVVTIPPYKVVLEEPVTPQQLQKYEAYAAQWHRNTKIAPGIAMSVDWNYYITPSVQVGINLLMNTYVYFGDFQICPAILPDLRITHSF